MQIHKVNVKTTMDIYEDNLNYLNDFKNFNNKLKKDTLENGDIQKHKTNVKATMTTWGMMSSYESYQELLKIIVSKIPLYQDIGTVKGDYPSFVCGNMWGAVYQKKQFTNEHAHTGVFSFTYYVKAEKNCAPLIFTKPGYKKFQPTTGSLFIWKSDYYHKVPPGKNNDLRIVIAGNLDYFFGKVDKVLLSKPVEKIK
tara:strand:- start:1141 stop:1731 length:591 start_codon:yes stop_codon:yes gene_type:complete